MGTPSFIFYSLVAWLPTIILSKEMTGSFAGTMALTFQLTAIPTTLIILIFSDEFNNQQGLVMITCLLYLSEMSLFLFSQTQTTMLLAIVLMALGMGGSISLSIAFISLRSSNSTRASELSGVSQSAGYLLAAVGPISMGVIFDTFNSWTLPISIFIGLINFHGFFGWFAGNDTVT